jgi:type I restriction enzyme M protein
MQQLEQSSQLPAIKLKSLISYPIEAQSGKKYLLTIDVQLDEVGALWPYPEEEYEISLQLNLHPFFSYQALTGDTPTIILHRFGGSYGAAEFILTANTEEVPKDNIKITFRNASGLTIAYFELPCAIRQDVKANAEQPHVTVTTSSTENVSITPVSPTTSAAPAHIEKIEQQLQQVGWTIVEYADFEARSWGPITKENPMLIPAVAVKSPPSYPNDYILVIAEEIIGFIKTQHPDEPLTDSTKTIFSTSFARTMHISCKYDMIPFVYEATGTETQITNKLEINARCREIYTFHQPATLQRWIDSVPDIFATTNDLFRSRLQNMAPLKQGKLRSYQFEGLQALEQSLAQQHPRALIQMATGRGKTYTLTHSIYRLLKYTNAKRILYIVDIPIAKKYAIDAFEQNVVEQDDQNNLFEIQPTFADMYNIQPVDNHILYPTEHVYVAMPEDIYPLLAETQPTSVTTYDDGSVPIKYNTNLPIEYFDVIVLAESERVKYSIWKPLLEYFDAPIIGIADTVTDEVLDFFHQNLVYPSQGKREEVYKANIKGVRTLLRKDAGLTGDADYLPQLIWLLFLKNLDDFEMTQEETYGDKYIPIIEKPYRWRDWAKGKNMTVRRTGDELLNFVNNDLTNYLKKLSGENNRDTRTIVGTIFQDNYNHLSSGYTLREIVNKMNNINFSSSDDIQSIVLIYETMLKEMRGSAGDSGEFYTPRPIIRFIIDRLNPQLGESIMDPACGTAGFLVEAYTRMNKQVSTTEQRQLLFDSLIGIEKQSVPYLLAIMNMLLHGIDAPNIVKRNALTVNINQMPNDERVNVIATNLPFGGGEDDDIIKNFPPDRRTHETALLFLQYIMTLLKRPDGRCGVVLPNGFLFGRGIATSIKEDLLQHFNVHTIIRLPNGVFSPYTGIPTNILFFEAVDDLYLRNNLYPSSSSISTQEIWYYEIPLPEGRKSYTKTRSIQDEDFQACLNWWDNRVENASAWKVSIEKIIANRYNLDIKNPHTN